jgi:hypothetical protein
MIRLNILLKIGIRCGTSDALISVEKQENRYPSCRMLFGNPASAIFLSSSMISILRPVIFFRKDKKKFRVDRQEVADIRESA